MASPSQNGRFRTGLAPAHCCGLGVVGGSWPLKNQNTLNGTSRRSDLRRIPSQTSAHDISPADDQYLGLLQHVLDKVSTVATAPEPGPEAFLVTKCVLTCASHSPYSPPKKSPQVDYQRIAVVFSGRTDNAWLFNMVRYLEEWATAEQCARFGRPEGDLGPIYGHQWRNWCQQTRRRDLYSRRRRSNQRCLMA